MADAGALPTLSPCPSFQYMYNSLWGQNFEDVFSTISFDRDGVQYSRTQMRFRDVSRPILSLEDIFVRQEYITTVQAINAYLRELVATRIDNVKSAINKATLEESKQPRDLARDGLEMEEGVRGLMVLTGHPGIGKSICAEFLIAIRLLQKLPTVIQPAKGYLVYFDRHGVWKFSDSDLEGRWILCNLIERSAWIIIDTGSHLHSPGEILRNPCPQFVLQVSSPRAERWHFSKYWQPRVAVYIMAPFNKDEIILAAGLQEWRITEERALNRFELYGPSARDAYLGSDNDTMDEELASLIQNLTFERLSSLFTSVGLAMLTDESRRLFLFAPRPGNRTVWDVQPISQHVFTLLWNGFLQKQDHRVYDFFEKCYSNSRSATLAGWIFENSLHGWLPRRLSLRLQAMALHPITAKNTKNAVFSIQREAPFTELSISQRKVHLYSKLQDLGNELDPTLYYRPKRSNEPVCDSFIFERTLNTLVLFQITVAKNHDVSLRALQKLVEFAEQRNISNIYIIAVIPSSELVMNVPLELYTKVKMFTHVVPKEAISKGANSYQEEP